MITETLKDQVKEKLERNGYFLRFSSLVQYKVLIVDLIAKLLKDQGYGAIPDNKANFQDLVIGLQMVMDSTLTEFVEVNADYLKAPRIAIEILLGLRQKRDTQTIHENVDYTFMSGAILLKHQREPNNLRRRFVYEVMRLNPKLKYNGDLARKLNNTGLKQGLGCVIGTEDSFKQIETAVKLYKRSTK